MHIPISKIPKKHNLCTVKNVNLPQKYFNIWNYIQNIPFENIDEGKYISNLANFCLLFNEFMAIKCVC